MPTIIAVYVRRRRLRWSRMTKMTTQATMMPSAVHMRWRDALAPTIDVAGQRSCRRIIAMLTLFSSTTAGRITWSA